MNLRYMLPIVCLPLAACAADGTMGGGAGGHSATSAGHSATTGGHSSATGGHSSATGDMTPTTRAGYVPMAAASDLFEIQSSQLALTRAQNPAVREFAQMMIDHHKQTTTQLTAAATAAGTPPQPMLMPMQEQMLTQLHAATGGEFDRTYIGQQVRAHEMALALHSTYARSGDTPALRSVAATATPIVQRHLDRARQLNQGA